MLHDRHITEFDGSFAEWEAVSEERAHAAAVRAAEDEELRRVKERQKVQQRSQSPQSTRAAQSENGSDARAGRDGREAQSRETRRQQRQAEQALQRAEQDVARLEARVAELTRELDDPELYVKAGGVERATKLGAELDRTRTQLDAALAEWATATEAVERLAAAKG